MACLGAERCMTDLPTMSSLFCSDDTCWKPWVLRERDLNQEGVTTYTTWWVSYTHVAMRMYGMLTPIFEWDIVGWGEMWLSFLHPLYKGFKDRHTNCLQVTKLPSHLKSDLASFMNLYTLTKPTIFIVHVHCSYTSFTRASNIQCISQISSLLPLPHQMEQLRYVLPPGCHPSTDLW